MAINHWLFHTVFWYDSGPNLAFELGVWTQVDSLMQTTEAVAETVEKVADKVDKVVEDLADSLPEGKLKQTARYIENIAEKAERDAHLVDEAIEKVFFSSTQYLVPYLMFLPLIMSTLSELIIFS